MFIKNTSMTAERLPVSFICGVVGCYWRTGHKTLEDARIVEKEHLDKTCPLKGKTRTVDPNEQPYTNPLHGKSISEKLWEELDRIIDSIKEEDPRRPEIDKFRLQGKAQGIAFALCKMQFNFYPEETGVLRQAQRRWRMRQKEIVWEPTPGYKYNLPPSGTLAKDSFFPKATTSSRRPAASRSKLPADKQAAIRNGRKNGMSDEDMASIFAVPLDEIRAIQ